MITKGQRPRRDGGTTRSQRVKGHGRMEDRRDHKGSEATEGWRDNEITKGYRPRTDGEQEWTKSMDLQRDQDGAARLKE